MRSAIGRYFRGDVSRSTLLTRLLPLSAVLFFGTLIAGACFFPVPYDWRRRVMSHLLSPGYNPDGYWIPSIGVALATALALPFGGYVEQRLRTIAPKTARSAGIAFTLGFLLLLSVAVPQENHRTTGIGLVHEILARSSVGALAIGVICCSLCAFKDRLRNFGGTRSLDRALAFCWLAIALLPITVGALSGALKIGEQTHQAWAKHIHDLLHGTPLWRLAFWEWIGMVVIFVFLFLSVLWLPEQIKAPSQPEETGVNGSSVLICL